MSYYLSLAIDIIATIASVFVLTLILIQLRQQNKQARFQALDQVQRRLAAPEFRQALGNVLSHSAESLAGSEAAEVKRQIEHVVGVYQRVGRRLREGVLPRKATLASEWKTVEQLRERLSEPIALQRQPEDMSYWDDFAPPRGAMHSAAPAGSTLHLIDAGQ
jgi:hypothetical protein